MTTAQIPTIGMRVRHFATQYSMTALLLMSVCPLRALAQDVHSHTQAQQQQVTAGEQTRQDALLRVVRRATERFKDVRAA